MADVKMTLACWNYDRTRALMDGSVKPEGIELTYHNSFPAATFHRMMGNCSASLPTKSADGAI